MAKDRELNLGSDIISIQFCLITAAGRDGNSKPLFFGDFNTEKNICTQKFSFLLLRAG